MIKNRHRKRIFHSSYGYDKIYLKKINPKCAIEQIGDTTLSSAWIAAMSNGQQPSASEDYIEVEK